MTAVADMSLEQQVALLSPEEQEALLADSDPEALLWDWGWNGRPSQILPVATAEGGDEWTLALALAGRGFGKACRLDTMLPSTLPVSGLTGWSKLGDLNPGDQVFDETGKPCSVLAVYDRTPDDAYRVTFSDNTYIDACGEHQWVTWTHQDRKQYLRNNPGARTFPAGWPAYRQPLFQALATGGRRPTGKHVGPEIRTTRQLLATLRQANARKDLNHCIPLAGALDLPPRNLLLDPWLLGYWLGNGASATGQVCGNGWDETEVRAHITQAGFLIGKPVAQPEGKNLFTFTVLRLVGVLRELGVLNNKHVPQDYMWAAEDQRRAVLAGLLDSDGYCDPVSGHIEFCSTTQSLADAVVQLARSLGEKPIIKESRSRGYGIDYGPKWRVTWRPNVDPFTFSRRSAMVKPLGAQALRNHHRMIVSIDPIPVVPMRCITVDSPNSMYLIGEGMIPTHNTLMGAQWIRALDQAWRTLGRDQSHMRVALVGRTAADVRDVMLEGPSGLLNVYPPSQQDRLLWTPSRRRLELPNGAVCLTYSAEEPSQLRGPGFHVGWADELATYKQIRSIDDDASTWENLRIAVRLGNAPQVLATTTPKRVPLLRQLLSESVENPKKFIIRRGKTTDNKYLSEGYLDVLMSLYGGTALGKQELEGEMLDDVAGAMTSEAIVNRNRLNVLPDGIPWIKLVSIDPSVAERPQDECGIVVVYISKTWPVLKRHAFVVDDLSVRAAPAVWGEIAVRAAHKHNATIVAETNQGANLVFQMLRQSADALGMSMPPMKEVWATKAKAVRAEPVGGAYARGRVHHIGELFPELESQITSFVAGESGYSPDRQDSLVQAVASGLFPEAITSGGMGTTVLRTVADQHIPLGRNERRSSFILPTSRPGFRGY